MIPCQIFQIYIILDSRKTLVPRIMATNEQSMSLVIKVPDASSLPSTFAEPIISISFINGMFAHKEPGIRPTAVLSRHQEP